MVRSSCTGSSGSSSRTASCTAPARLAGNGYNGIVRSEPDLLFEALTPLGFQVRVTRERWNLITTAKHPSMVGRESSVKATLENPEEVRRSRSDPQVLLFYRAERMRRWVCAVTRRTGHDGFLVTAYPTDAIKEGTRIWPN